MDAEVGDAMKPIAVVGMACRFPDDATCPSAFYDMLANGRSAWSEVPKNRFNVDSYYHPSNTRIGSTNTKGAHWVKQDPAVFDAPFFSMTASEAASLDPQLRMMLEITFECFESAGLPIESLVGSDTSTFVGSSSSEYAHIMGSDIDNIPLYAAIGSGVSMLANRLSHFYDLRGPSVALDTACSSGLVATFDDRANGYARGEGICVMVLKDLDEALRDGDTIRAVIRGSGTNQDGKTPGIVQPNSEAQEDLIRATYAAAGIDPRTTHYFEAHGTGTRIGDPLELNALVNSLKTRERSAADPLYVGSVKTNIGHLEGAAGLAGLLKTILSLENGVIVPHLNFDKPNPKLPLDQWNLKVPTKLTPWPKDGLRRASVNSFGYGGSNAHCIVDDAHNYLEQHGLQGHSATVPMPPLSNELDEDVDSGLGSLPSTPDREVNGRRARLFILSSPEQAALQRLTDLYATYVKSMKPPSNRDNTLANLAFTLSNRRSLFQWRTALVADSADGLISTLEKPIKSNRSGKPPKSVFLFTGQGAQWHAMGRELLQYEVFFGTIKNADKYLKEELQADWSVLEELNASERDSRIHLAKFSQPLGVILQTALVDLLTHWGIRPAAVVGHSSGEIAGAYAAGALSAKDCWKVAYHRGRLSQKVNEIAPELKGAMMSVGLSEEAVLPYLNRLDPSEIVVIACINSPSNVTLSGDSAVLKKLEERLTSEKVFARRIKVEMAYHSPHMRLIADEYLASIESIQTLPTDKTAPTFYSSVTGAEIHPSALEASYWVRNMVSPVQFVEALGAIFPLAKAGARRRRRDGLLPDTILEIGPHGALQGPVRQILAKNGRTEETQYSSILHRGKDAIVSSLEVMGNLWTKGQTLNFLHMNSPEANPEPLQSLTDLPLYPWNHTNKFWHESHTNKNHRLRRTPRLDLLGYPVNDFNSLEPRWVNHVRISENPWLADYMRKDQVILSPASMLCAVLEAGRQIAQSERILQGFEFRNVTFGELAVVAAEESGIGIFLQVRRRGTGSKIDESNWQEFTLYSEQNDDINIEHCSGLFQIQYRTNNGDGDYEALEEARAMADEYKKHRADCKRPVSPEVFYQDWKSYDIRWGPQFQGLVNIQTAETVACTTVSIRDTQEKMPAKFEFDHLMHPTTLDACFQGTFAPISGNNESRELTSIDSVYISADVPKGAGSEFVGYSTLTRQGFTKLVGSVVMSDKDWSGPKVVAKGVNYKRISSSSGGTTHKKQPWEIKKICSNLVWKPDLDQINQEQAMELFAPSMQASSQTTTQKDSTAPLDCNSMMARWLELSGHKKPYQKILEVSGGSTLLTLHALEALGGRNGTTPCFGQYVFTDRDSQSWVESKKSLKAWEGRVEFKQLDVELDLCNQEFELESFDVVLAGQAPSAAKSIDIALSRCSQLLRPGGKLVLSADIAQRQFPPESTSKFETSSISTRSEADWNRHLIAAGLTGIEIVTKATGGNDDQCSSMVVTSKQAVSKMNPSSVVIVQDQNASLFVKTLSFNVSEKLTSLGLAVEVVSLEQAVAEDSYGRMLIAGKAIISLLEADVPLVATLSEQEFGLLKNLLLGGMGGMWITRSNRQLDPSGDPAFSSTVGLIRTLRNENPEGRLHELAFSSKMDISSAEAASLIVRATKSVFEADSLQVEAETEYGELDGCLHIPRIYDEPYKNRALDMMGKESPTELESFHQDDNPLRLDIGTPGKFDTLRFVHDPLALEQLGNDEVEIEVHANGLSFSDVTISKGLTDSTEMGLDASGIVKRVGTTVKLVKPGDRVATLCSGAIRSLLRADESLVVKVPDAMSLEDAASLPAAYTVAYQALCEVGRLMQGETVLIHSATGGVGQAAIQIAKYVGAEVFVTAGSTARRESLTNKNGIPKDHGFNSRDLSFAKGIMRVTKGKGVDVVVNSLSGEALRKTWECTAMFGRFVELGKKDVLHNCALEMSHFHRNIAFTGINLENMLRYDRKQAARALHASFDLIEAGVVGLIKPTTVYTYGEMEKAFSIMEKAEHMGKLILKSDPKDLVPAIPRNPHPLKLKEDATYVILGGLGGIGRFLTLRLAEHGAKNIAFFSRSGDVKPKAKALMQELRDMGVNAISYICDVADSSVFESTMARISNEMPPTKGVIHATMVLNDEDFKTMTYEQWNNTTRNKIQGGLNMHRLMPADLDFCVLMSSIAPIMGNGTQSNYAAGNSFLDGLAWHRRSHNLAACALNFGFIAGIGWAAENVKISDKHRADYDLSSIHPPEVWSMIESAITGFQYKDIPMPPQMGTCAGSGGQAQMMKHIETWMHYNDPKYAYMRQLDVLATGKSPTTTATTIALLRKSLTQTTSLPQAADIVEDAIAAKLSRVMFMAAEDIDTSKPVSVYGVDSLIVTEIRNWIFDVLRSGVGMAELLNAESIAALAVKTAEGSLLVPEEVRREGRE